MSGTLYILCQLHIKRGGVQMTSSSLSERGMAALEVGRRVNLTRV